MALSVKMKILIIDDMSQVRMSVKQMLNSIGFKNIHEAESVRQALSLMAESIKAEDPVKFVICDYQMPELSGVDLVIKIKENDHLKDVPFLLMSGEAGPEEIRDAISKGVKHIILKPFSAADLQDKIAGIFKQ